MRWRFVDRIEEFEPWAFVKGHKSISLEEYILLEPFGRQGSFPETLSLESCIHLARWLVVRSSDFQQTCLLSEIDSFTFKNEASMGDTLNMVVSVRRRKDDLLEIECEATANIHHICRGTLTLDLVTLTDSLNPKTMRTMWQELYDKA
jgi:3-hydroxymyristoyl/3-hydroxydecanoyl-(acyl carrier protein) dehydratase